MKKKQAESINRIIKFRETHNFGRRMICDTNDYLWQGSPWDWVLYELEYIGMDSISIIKWKKAAAYLLALDAKRASTYLSYNWKNNKVITKLIAIKSSALVKQAFYDQYMHLKRFKDEGKSISELEPKRLRTKRHLQNLMRWIILHYGFQYEVPTTVYKELLTILDPSERNQEPPSAIPPITNDIKVEANNEDDLITERFVVDGRSGPELSNVFDSSNDDKFGLSYDSVLDDL